jgi:putative nucleotidyltransferase with HDIG domain
MKKINDELVEEVRTIVTEILTNELSGKLLFHTINHTLDVLKNAEYIGKKSMLNEDDMNILRVGALFHDVGYVDTYDDHERYSAEKAVAFLESKNIDKKSIDIIRGAILSTRMPQSPENEISRILCDADLMYLTFDNYFEQSELMRLEWENVGKEKLNIHEFNLRSLEFFKMHQFKSEYGRKVLNHKKKNNEMLIIEKTLINM